MIVLTLYFICGLTLIINLYQERLFMLGRGLMLLSALAHLLFTARLWQSIGHIPLTNPAQSLNLMLLLTTIIMAPLIWHRKTAALGAFYLPAAACIFGAALPFMGAQHYTLNESPLWYPLHTVCIISGEALFSIAAIGAVVYLIHERQIRQGRIHRPGSLLPPLGTLDKLIYTSLGLAFIGFSCGMLFGVLWAGNLNVSLLEMLPKAIIGALTWLALALTLHQRFAIGWQGGRTAKLTILAFAICTVLSLISWLCFPQSHGLGLIQ